MWGGWYVEKETQQLIGHLKTIFDQSLSTTEALFIADPQSALII
jgi:hypothetical protein